MPRFKITVQYDGTGFRGWQLQKKDRTVQGEIEDALQILNQKESIRVHGAGRTDTGVHATGQVAHFDFNTDLDTCALQDAINGNLARDVKIMDCTVVSPEFHARFSATRRYYNYRCRTNNFLLDRSYTWKIGSVSLPLLNEAAGMIVGNHDFTSFSRNSENLEHRRCIVYDSVWKEDGAVVNYQVSGNRFLHHMVRYLVGTMVEISRGKYKLEQFKELINHPIDNVNIYKAPPQGLALTQVDYDE
ncbi:MAG: tRNA pseudouridine(38-40) synthase TruA [Candidatus Marinimicrobia bacterium]|nr:tRNA pseudouridine(38-40) synthase TruA [Candidatus Neomarinimicrobiota bacterium]MBL7009794.1 tRNA pseudouridine(38-40) synthase TruA [Candidatus Neomarinimicrobiota bacterium]MBL7029802.1 tRNA pseudouridine(38-40) synthase TruA [Candidatus Neomarinimicrobiota bacterium]